MKNKSYFILTSPLALINALEVATNASSHSTGTKFPLLSFTNGVINRWRLSPSYEKRDLSDNHSSLIS